MKKYNDKLIFYRTKSGAIACFDPTKAKENPPKNSNKKLAVLGNGKKFTVSAKDKNKRDGKTSSLKYLNNSFKSIWKARKDAENLGFVPQSKQKRLMLVDDEETNMKLATDPLINTEDVTKEYINLKRKEGTFENRTGSDKKHNRERAVAKWLYEKFGGDIIVLDESGLKPMEKVTDFLWNNECWELKSPSSYNAISSRGKDAFEKEFNLRNKKLHGIIFDIEENTNMTTEGIIKVVKSRINESAIGKIDVLIKQGNKLVRAYRINHIKK